MKTKTTRTSLLRMFIPVLFMTLPGMSSAQADYPITFDLGTDPDKTTYLLPTALIPYAVPKLTL